jgi:hypothetical protein
MLNLIRYSRTRCDLRSVPNEPRSRRNNRCSLLRDSSCCQTRSTRQPDCLNLRVTRPSRALFRASLAVQNSWLLVGWLACFGQLCQKHPSTKTATLDFANTKSGFPNTCTWRRHPAIPWRRKKAARAISVALFPRPRTRAMISERLAAEKTSVIGSPVPSVCFLVSNRIFHATKADEVARRAAGLAVRVRARSNLEMALTYL